MNLFNKIKNLFIKKQNVEVEVLKGIDLENMHTSPEVAENIRTKVQDAISRKEEIKPRYEEIISKITFIQKIEDLPKEELIELENIAKLLSETVLEKETFQKLLKSEENDADYLEEYKDQIEKAIRLIEEHEKDLAIIKNDLSHLEGEKAEIAYQTKRAKTALSFIKTLLIITAFGASIVALILTTMFFVYGFDIFLPSLVAVIIIFALGLWIFIFRRYLIHELTKYQMLQKREVELTNKTKIKFVNVKQFLDYEYKKYQVNSSEMLKIRWENYQRHTKNEEKLKKISNDMSSLIQDLERILMRNNLDNQDECKFVIDRIDYFIAKKERKKLLNSLNQEKDDLKLEYDRCENEIRVLSKLLG